MATESPRSRMWRRGTGTAGVAAWLGALALAVLDWRNATTVTAVVAVCLPPVAFIGHLALTDALTWEQKAVWRQQTRAKRRMLVAQFTYLFADDLPAATARLSPAPTRSARGSMKLEA
jgi:hypothetical protein